MNLGWVDFSDNDRKKVLEVIHLLSEKGAVDELGFGIIRDGFADYFFPGTSTVQTRAKYYLLVPYILKDAVNKDKPERYLDTTEKNVAVEMFNKNMKDGLIGADSIAAGKWVVRAPSDIYWNGIKKLGIFKQDISINQYFLEYEKLKKLKKNTSGNTFNKDEEGEHDDSDAGSEGSTNFWNLPTYKDNWRDNLKLNLTSREAAFLRKRILNVKTKTGKQTLYSYILSNNIKLDNYDSFEELSEDIKKSVHPELCEMLDLADSFNKLAMIAKCRYNILISGGLNEEASSLWKENKNKLDKIACIDVDKIFIKLNLRNQGLKLFLKQLQILLKEYEIDKIDELIKIREKKIKGTERAKLLHPEKFNKEDFQDYFVGTAFLDYRMHSAKRILNDIYEAEHV